ncbi:hypothetical protein GOV14_01475 [Candidatus Pacearchaeota archaeon]|nr:hypothetical protein [Candidatus Pacearchaeota archaeon]
MLELINLWIVVGTAILFELITIFGRFYLKISSKKIYLRLMKKFKLKRFYHFHHLFTGIILAIIFYYLKSSMLFSLGLGIMFSDVIHHFVVLWSVLGHPEFHIVYKNIKAFNKEEKIEKKQFKKFFRHIVHEA